MSLINNFGKYEGVPNFFIPHISITDRMTPKFYFIFRNSMQRGVSVKIYMKTNLTDFTQYEVKKRDF